MASDLCDQLDDYLDGVLDPPAADRFAEHLAGCKACRRLVQFEQTIANAVRKADQSVVLPAALIDRTHVAIRRQERRRRLTWTVGIAASVLVCISLVMWQRHHDAARDLPQASDDPVRAQVAEQEVPLPDTLSPDNPLEPPPQPIRTDKAIVRVQGEGRPSHIAEVRPSASDNVTFVMLWPTIGDRHATVDDESRQPSDDTLFRKGTYQ